MINKIGCCFWITGLSGAGKTTLSLLLKDYATLNNYHVIYLDGDELRNLFNEAGYTVQDRINLAKKYSNLCKYLVDQGCIVVIGVMALFSEIHQWNRKNINNYREIFIDVPMSELFKRDPKGLYKSSLDGKKNIAGLDLQIEVPENPNLHLRWSSHTTKNDMSNILNNYFLETMREING